MKVKINKSPHSTVLAQLFDDVVFKFKRNVLKKEMTVPWMRYREIAMIKDLLANLKPKNILEWGAGDGTLYFTHFIPENSKWLSVEHNKEWTESVVKKNNNSNVSIVFQGPNSEPFPDAYNGLVDYKINDGTYEDFRDYIEYPDQQNILYDFILIDGRARVDCLNKSKEMLNENGIVMLHDANRPQYHHAFKQYKNGFLFSDQRFASGGIWIGSNSEKPLSNFIDIETYSKVWDLYERIGKVIKV